MKSCKETRNKKQEGQKPKKKRRTRRSKTAGGIWIVSNEMKNASPPKTPSLRFCDFWEKLAGLKKEGGTVREVERETEKKEREL